MYSDLASQYIIILTSKDTEINSGRDVSEINLLNVLPFMSIYPST